MLGGRRRKLLADTDEELSLFDDDDREVLRGDVDLSRHFSYYAYEGGNGHQRWTHEVRAMQHTCALCAATGGCALDEFGEWLTSKLV
jgi:hypothetical protein